MDGALRVVTVPAPAAGVDFVHVHPAGVVSKIRNLRMTFVPDANVEDRFVVFSTFEPGGLLMSAVMFIDPTIDSFPLNCHIALDGRQSQFVFFRFGTYINQAESPAMYLLPGWTVRSQVQGLQVGDQISDIRLELEDLSLVAPGAVA